MQFTGAIYQAPVHIVCGGCLAAKFPTVDGGGLEVTVAALPNGCCQSCPNCTVSQVTTILHEQFYIQNMLGGNACLHIEDMLSKLWVAETQAAHALHSSV